jgi:hypothetical protein
MMHEIVIESLAARPSSGEGLARMAAEGDLLKRHGGEYRRLLRSRDHVEAVRALVKRYSAQYGALVHEHRERVAALRSKLKPAA